MKAKIALMAWTICLFGLSACGSTPEIWKKEGGTQASFNVDRYACLQQSQQMSGSALGNMASLEAVTNKELFYACLSAHGWVYVTETVAPPRITQMPVLPAPVQAPGALPAQQAPWPTAHMYRPPAPAEKSGEIEVRVVDMNLPMDSNEKALCAKVEFTEILARTHAPQAQSPPVLSLTKPNSRMSIGPRSPSSSAPSRPWPGSRSIP